MKGREGKTAPSADLLVCFPSRAHLALMPKPICSPARPSEPTKRHHNHHPRHHSLLKKSSTRSGSLASPLLWNKNKQMGSEISEPTSPKVTCAGQIKVRHKTSSCKNWQSVMEEIERIHNSRKNSKKRPSWIESLGFKKEIMQFLTCLRSIRLDFRCFGTFPQTDTTTDDEDQEENDEKYQRNLIDHAGNDGNEASRTIFSQWFMVLQENQNNGFCNEQKTERETPHHSTDNVQAAIPPPNALLLMRCRSAPAKSWQEEKEEDKENKRERAEVEEKEEMGKKGETRKNLRTLMDEEKRNKEKEETDFYEISPDIVKETWIVGGTQDPLSRSRSWKR
ncbi:hypothetical protein SLE2022_326450 [Rubroshorea leprosula]